MRAVVDRAIADARALANGGAEGAIIENFNDAPFHPTDVPSITVAAMTRVAAAVRERVDFPIGVNVLRNDALAALSIAAAAGAQFVRVNVHAGALLTDQGWIEGRAWETLRERARLGAHVAIFADVAVKHAHIPPGFDIADAARDMWHRGLADALIVTGGATAQAPDPARVQLVRDAVPEAFVWVGSGVTIENAAALTKAADGVIVGSALQHDGKAGTGVDPTRVAPFVAAIGGRENRAGTAGLEPATN